MNKPFEFALKASRKIYSHIFSNQQLSPKGIEDPEEASRVIYELLSNNQPCMIARFGSTELNAISNYKGIKEYKNNIIGFIKRYFSSVVVEFKRFRRNIFMLRFFPCHYRKCEQIF